MFTLGVMLRGFIVVCGVVVIGRIMVFFFKDTATTEIYTE